MVFEGGGAKGMVFVGALEELLRDGSHSAGRLLGTSAGAITAVLLAARYSAAEMQAALVEKDAAGRPVFESFMGMPTPFTSEQVRSSAVRRFLNEMNLPFVPDFVESRMDDWIATQMAAGGWPRNLFSFIERGGWYSADAFTAWMERKLNEGSVDGKPRDFGGLTLAQLHQRTGMELTVVAADTTAMRILYLNHRTAPQCPVVWAARMSMSIPLLWQEVIWQKEWGPYNGEQIAGTVVVDGGMLSNFPIALFLSTRPEVGDIVGPPQAKNVLGFLIDDRLDVPNLPPPPEMISLPAGAGELRTVRRLTGLVSTMMSAHDNMAVTVFAKHVVRLPSRGIGTTQFDMSDGQRNALVEGGRRSMREFLAQQEVLESLTGGLDLAPSPDDVNLANDAALEMMR
jgi:predicted acylesterase/phospholipase RssA